MAIGIDPHRLQSRFACTPRVGMGVIAHMQNLIGL
jgi:hypothetical protein